MKKLLILIAVLVVGLGINACNAHGLYWDWDASYDPTTADTNGDGTYDWVERYSQPPDGGLTTDDGRYVWSPDYRFQLLDTRPYHDFKDDPLYAEVVWKSYGTGEYDAVFWMYVDITVDDDQGVFYAFLTSVGDEQLLDLYTKSEAHGQTPLGQIVIPDTDYFLMRWDFALDFDQVTVRIDQDEDGTFGDIYTYRYDFVPYIPNPDSMASIGGAEGKVYVDSVRINCTAEPEPEPEPDDYVDLIKFDYKDDENDALGEDRLAGTHTFEVEIDSEFEYIQVTTKAGREEAVTQIGVGDDPVTDDLGFVIELVSVEDGVYKVAVSSTDQTPKALSYVILGAGKEEGKADPVLIGVVDMPDGYVVETDGNLHANCFKDTPAGPKPKNQEAAAAAAPKGPSQEVLAKKAALEAQKALAADARFTRKQAHMADIFRVDPDGMPLKGPR